MKIGQSSAGRVSYHDKIIHVRVNGVGWVEHEEVSWGHSSSNVWMNLFWEHNLGVRILSAIDYWTANMRQLVNLRKLFGSR